MADVGASAEEPNRNPRRPDMMIPIELIEANPDQPRRDFPREALEELAASIREKGIIQPLIVRDNPKKIRWLRNSCRRTPLARRTMAQLHSLPVLVREVSDTELLELAIIENIQRADLNAVEEAMGYRQLMDRFGHTQEKMAEALSKAAAT